ncbi:MAG: hypothetical protein JXB38_08225 [Anaerolineales bacterium]|nr:hypothetical protein [Anaerolineales bacterium]
MFPTVETRWFGEGPVPRHVRAWFRSGDRRPEIQPARSDYYFRLPGNHALGIKMREGRIEIKQCTQVFGVTDFQASVIGVIEGWDKWSFDLEAADTYVTGVQAMPESWLGVVKERWLCKYTLEENNAILAIPVQTMAAFGCNLELTWVEVENLGETWWTLGLEAYGQGVDLYDLLRKVGGHVFARGDRLYLKLRDSYSYPQWLSGVWGRN